MVDGADESRLPEAAQAFTDYVLPNRSPYSTVAILINKQDLPDYQTPSLITTQYPVFQPKPAEQGAIDLFGTAVKTNAGIRQAMEWLFDQLGMELSYPFPIEETSE
jgi:hypothetical protein